ADHAALDITDASAVRATCDAVKPDAVVHAASWTAVDACESDPERADAVNAVGARHVAEAAAAVGAHVVHISTDYVFDGTKPTPYVESDAPNPMSVYGRSKWDGEQHVHAANDEAAIVRISWVCGRYGKNMVKTLLRLAGDGVDPKFVDDQIGHPTIVGDLVPMLRRFALERRSGLFHVTNQGPVSWYEFARLVFDAAGADPKRVTPIATADLDPPRPAPRPANSVLDNAALRAAGIPLLPHHEESVVRLVRQLSS
ncbi:MAG TPA: dTDP-4-dehydrorhamnose reductase, partial [Acidimicrobiales bacterium]|nr:dTDP-4-dehydrorhamnose reductase [Acidimicrobiales bacterium]